MEHELWCILYRTVREVARNFSQKYVKIPGWVLVLTFLWAALHDRPVAWACQADNWKTTHLRPARIPSPATMSRRIDRVGIGLLWRAIEERLRVQSADVPSLLAFLDGKPLTIGGCSKDPDAGYGRAAGTKAKGYKFHTIWSNRALPETWEVDPINISEKTIAARLIPQLRTGGYLIADGNYDTNALFDLAWSCGYQLVVPLPRGVPGSGHHYQSPHRWRSIKLMTTPFGRDLYRQRISVEEKFGNSVSFGGGLAPLPAWVRGLDRVRTWVWAKLLINAARIIKNKDLRHI